MKANLAKYYTHINPFLREFAKIIDRFNIDTFETKTFSQNFQKNKITFQIRLTEKFETAGRDKLKEYEFYYREWDNSFCFLECYTEFKPEGRFFGPVTETEIDSICFLKSLINHLINDTPDYVNTLAVYMGKYD